VVIGLAVKAFRSKPASGNEGLVNMVGETAADVHKDGKVFIHGEYWRAKSDTPIEAGTEVRVVKVEDMVLWIKQKEG
jgi:membrane-bound serine protease (ClpP class)